LVDGVTAIDGVSFEPSYLFTASPEGAEGDMAYSNAALNEHARRVGGAGERRRGENDTSNNF
jgi:hypothetical protein